MSTVDCPQSAGISLECQGQSTEKGGHSTALNRMDPGIAVAAEVLQVRGSGCEAAFPPPLNVSPPGHDSGERTLPASRLRFLAAMLVGGLKFDPGPRQMVDVQAGNVTGLWF